MIFYVIPSHNGEPKRLEATQADARSACKARDLKPSDFEQIDIDTDKAGLMATLNELYAAASDAEPAGGTGLAEVFPPERSSPVIADRPLAPRGIDADGHPRRRTHWTRSQVDAMFTRRSEHVQDICHAISKLSGADLGYVAFEVASKIAEPFMPSEPEQEEPAHV
jgi:hypothetical protein